KPLPSGTLDMDDFRRRLDDQIAVFMITNPNTVGIFEPKMHDIAAAVHERGGLVYLDGANMNAILGIARPGDFGADMQHYNPHKTFTGPHGAGGPGDRKSTRLNSSHDQISYAVFCLKKKKKKQDLTITSRTHT